MKIRDKSKLSKNKGEREKRAKIKGYVRFKQMDEAPIEDKIFEAKNFSKHLLRVGFGGVEQTLISSPKPSADC